MASAATGTAAPSTQPPSLNTAQRDKLTEFQKDIRDKSPFKVDTWDSNEFKELIWMKKAALGGVYLWYALNIRHWRSTEDASYLMFEDFTRRLIATLESKKLFKSTVYAGYGKSDTAKAIAEGTAFILELSDRKLDEEYITQLVTRYVARLRATNRKPALKQAKKEDDPSSQRSKPGLSPSASVVGKGQGRLEC